jgi:hypothetical protein
VVSKVAPVTRLAERTSVGAVLTYINDNLDNIEEILIVTRLKDNTADVDWSKMKSIINTLGFLDYLKQELFLRHREQQ